VLTWWQGGIPINGFGLGEEIVANSSYKPIMHIHAGNGYMADLHSFSIEPHHTAVLTVYPTIRCDVSSDGGPHDGDLTDASFQELDLKTGLVRREWTSADHVALSASYASPSNASTPWPYDYFHLNTIDPRGNGTTLLSARNTSQLYLINDKSGQITSSIGGKHSTVQVETGAGTAYQHDADTLADGDISIFDNGGSPFEHPESRGLVIKLNADQDTDTKVVELVHPQAIKSESQGSVQELANGDWFVGWGQEPYFTQFDASGKMIYDAHMPANINSYRAYSFDWVGKPTTRPAIAIEPRGSGRLTVYASWNGATRVARWAVLGGATQTGLRRVVTRSMTGFETAMRVASEPYVRVLALDRAGAVIGRSARIAVPGWTQRLHHALAEAGLRCAETWANLLQWVR
jgi:Arylsulfotransferase (ASST)